MMNPLSKLMSRGERGGEASEQASGLRSLSSPPPLPPQHSAGAEPGTPGGDVFKAPTLRPPPPPAAGSVPPTAYTDAGGVAERRGSGFTSVIRHLSLRGWLHWIQWNRCDATLRVRTPDGGSGSIWCSAGKVVDAEWGVMAPEQALQELLRLSSGAVSIDFDPVDRPRRIASLPPLVEAPAAEAQSASAALRRGARRPSRAEVVAGGALLAAVVVFAFVLGRDRASTESEYTRATPPEQQTKSGLLPPPPLPKAAPTSGSAKPRDMPVIAFTDIEVEPAQAEIWLDQALVALGHIELAPMRDGVLHELRFVAAGHAPRSLYFVDSPPGGRVVLEPAEPAVAAAPTQAVSPIQGVPAEPALREPSEADSPASNAENREVARRSVRRHAPAAPRERAPAEPTASAAKAAPVKKSPQIQLIDARTPRVQVLE